MRRSRNQIIGRTIVFVLFGSSLAYCIVAVIGSVAFQLFGQAPPLHPDDVALGHKERTWCVRRIVGLRDELERHVNLELQRPKIKKDPFLRWQTWEQGWLDDVSLAHDRCVNLSEQTLDQAFVQLNAMHVDYQLAVKRIIQTRTQASVDLQESLRILKKSVRD